MTLTSTPFRWLLGDRVKRCAGHCVYCGLRCFGAACPSHRDLVQIDPGMGAT